MFVLNLLQQKYSVNQLHMDTNAFTKPRNTMCTDLHGTSTTLQILVQPFYQHQAHLAAQDRPVQAAWQS